MLKIGDLVVTAANGICKINDIVEMNMTGEKKTYFLLIPELDENAKIYIPADKADERMRKVMNQSQAMQLIESMGSAEGLKIENERERELKYKENIQSRDPLQMVAVIKHIYCRNEERRQQGKKPTTIDERYFKLAVQNLHLELSLALGMDESAILQRIKESVENK